MEQNIQNVDVKSMSKEQRAALLAQRLFAAQTAVSFVQNMKCHEVSSLLRAVF